MMPARAPGFDDRHARRGGAIDVLAGHSDRAARSRRRIRSIASPSRTRRRCRAGAAARNPRRPRVGSSRAGSRRRRARARRAATRRRRTVVRAAPARTTSRIQRRVPRRSRTPAAARRSAQDADGRSAGRLQSGGTVSPRSGGLADGGAGSGGRGSGLGGRRGVRVGRRGGPRQELDLHGERKAHRAHQARDSRCSPTGTSARRPTGRSRRATRCVRRWPGPAVRCGPSPARARFRRRGRNRAGR